ncbi:vacuolar protein sorting-associated protein 33B [Patella vulgata]|uniref:vacuolar protein sorting-associated protein 33B n=1 Tax=Patella vulgata TaxID=6465 RepID=UPI0021805F6A|nr:vacuolar protein sorting-associated protein 33B [Patella vulgata]
MDVHLLKQLQRDQLAHMLESEPGKKDFVIDPCFTKLLDRIAGATFLKDHGVDKIYKLDPSQKSLAGTDIRFYFVRPAIPTIKLIANHINAEKSSHGLRKYKIIMVPRKLHVCEKILESEGVYGSISIEDFNLELVTLDNDILSLELPDFLRNFYLDGDQTWLHTVASSIVHLENLYGNIPNVYCLGKGAQMTFDLINLLSDKPREESVEKGDNQNIGHLFIIDRDIDFVTPLCAPVTYEALLDEIYGIECGIIDLTNPDSTSNTPGKLLLTAENEIFQMIRNRHFSYVFAYISDKAKELKLVHDKKDDLKSVKDMRHFVSNDLRSLKQQQKLLAQHIGACEYIMSTKSKGSFEEFTHVEHCLLQGSDTKECINFIEECLYKQTNWLTVLRLICLLSLTEDGIQSKDYKSLRTKFLHSHGFDLMPSWFNLKKLGILTEYELPQVNKPLGKMASITRRGQFKSLSKRLNLVPKVSENVDLRTPNDMSYVFSGAYTPLACKLVDLILSRESLISLDDVLKLIPGGVKCDMRLKPASKARGGHSIPSSPAAKVVLVYFLGGCTFSEIAALRYLARREGYKITIATTAIITGNSFVESVMERKPI